MGRETAPVPGDFGIPLDHGDGIQNRRKDSIQADYEQPIRFRSGTRNGRFRLKIILLAKHQVFQSGLSLESADEIGR